MLDILLLHQPTPPTILWAPATAAEPFSLPMMLPSLLLVLVMKVVVDELGREGM